MAGATVRQAVRLGPEPRTARPIPPWLELDAVTHEGMTPKLLPELRQMLRMAGHLLEHHGTSRQQARRLYGHVTEWDDVKACRWCLLGATKVVARSMRWSSGDLWLALNVWLFGEVRLPSGADGTIQIWNDDGGRNREGWNRRRIIERLKECH